MHFGVDYYPEHWPEERWETDARLMREMGVEVVRLAEFAWHKLEPSMGEFDFSWLERALSVLDSQGIKAILGTPTAAPPAWLAESTPEILPVDSRGTVMGFGGRHHVCHSSAAYRSRVEGIVRAMARRFKGDGKVIGWQIDNELGNSQKELCHCESCARAFRAWLRRRYGTIDELNRRWGTVFWSQTYDSFDQVPTPRATPNAHGPSLLLDWRRFRSDLLAEFLEFQAGILREEVPGVFITHNMMGFADQVDYFRMGRSLDFVSHDQYVTGFWERSGDYRPHRYAANLDLMAALKRRSFWIMEQQAGQTGWEILGPDPEPGQLALWAAQSVAHGADAVVFFRWRSCTVGTEQFWHGILPHSGVPGRRYCELKSFISSLRPVMDEFEGALSEAEAAILFSYDEEWALGIQRQHPELDYVEQVLAYYKAFHDRNVPVDFVGEDGDFGRYKLLVAPLMYLCDQALASKLSDYAKRGGALVLTMRSGVKNADNVCMSDAPLPGALLGEALGIEIPEYDCLRMRSETIAFEGKNYSGSKWLDVVELKGARAAASCVGGRHAGCPAITEADFHDGKTYYVATEPDDALLDAFVGRALADAGVAPIGETPRGVELVRRRTDASDYVFALNHSSEARSVDAPPSWKKIVGESILGPRSFSVYRIDR